MVRNGDAFTGSLDEFVGIASSMETLSKVLKFLLENFCVSAVASNPDHFPVRNGPDLCKGMGALCMQNGIAGRGFPVESRHDLIVGDVQQQVQELDLSSAHFVSEH
ncbi:hypothetical protein NDU88_012033 [Pleurodeles waltl]|uniref:Uncharacterized protein n=1 Tax=Pleurodeles waltl TaxID=8319 RepID=A0AAV7R0V0_PLEWA|nr:hypothetical protein NDU88_012033 [Pleurodeles waltl]